MWPPYVAFIATCITTTLAEVGVEAGSWGTKESPKVNQPATIPPATAAAQKTATALSTVKG